MEASQTEYKEIHTSKLKNLYFPELSEDGDNIDEEDEVENYSIFNREFLQTSWHSLPYVPLKRASMESKDKNQNYTVEAEDISIYYFDIDPRFDILLHTDAEFEFPSITVKPQFKDHVEIRWTKNPAIHYGIYHKMIFDSAHDLDDFPAGWVEQYYNWNVQPQYRAVVDESVGDVPQMIEWSTHLPQKKCKYTLPFFYSYPDGNDLLTGMSSTFYLFFLGSQANIQKKLVFPKKIQESLLQVKINGKICKYAKDCQKMMVVGTHNEPQLFSRYGRMTDTEKKNIMYYKNKETNSYEVIDSHKFPIHKVTHQKAKDVTTSKRSSTLELTSDAPVLASFLTGLNYKALCTNDRCNHTDNEEDCRNGNYAIAYCKMKYQLLDKFELHPEDMTCIVTYNNFVGKPKYAGSYAYAYTKNPFRAAGMVGILFTREMGVSLECHYEEESIQQKDNVDEDLDSADAEALINKILSRSEAKKNTIAESVKTGDKNIYKTMYYELQHRDLVFTKTDNGHFYTVKVE